MRHFGSRSLVASSSIQLGCGVDCQHKNHWCNGMVVTGLDVSDVVDEGIEKQDSTQKKHTAQAIPVSQVQTGDSKKSDRQEEAHAGKVSSPH
jgi:hypothetical protein